MFKWLKKLFKRTKVQLAGMTWNDVTLGQFKRLKGLNPNDVDDQIEAASILLDIKSDDMLWKDFCKELRKLEFMNQEMPKTIIRKSYMLNGRKYITRANLQDLTVSGYMDFVNLAPSGDLEKILAVVLIPEGQEYGKYDLDPVYQDILTMSVVDAYAIFNFFKVQFIVCIKTMEDFSVKALKGNRELQKVVLEAMESCFMLDL